MPFYSRQVSSLKPTSQKIVSNANSKPTKLLGNDPYPLVIPWQLYLLIIIFCQSHITTPLSWVIIFWLDSCVSKDI